MLKQEWVDRVISTESAIPYVIDRGPEDDARDAWTLRYVARFIECGMPLSLALEDYRGGDHDYEDSPEQAADEAMSYWDDDGGEG